MQSCRFRLWKLVVQTKWGQLVSRDGIRVRLLFLRIRFEIFDTDCDTCLVSIPRSVESWLIFKNRFLSSRRFRRYLSDVSNRFKTYAEYHVRLIVSNEGHMGRTNLTERRLLRYETLETSAWIEVLRFSHFIFRLLNFCRNISKMTRFWKIQKKSSSGKKSKNLFEKQIDFAGKNHNYS